MLNTLIKLLSGAATVPVLDDHAFDREKVAFEQNFLQFRHLNEQMNKVPAFAVTLTGGFWYVAVIQHFATSLTPQLEATARFLLMTFAAIADLMLVLISIRIRDVMREYQRKISTFTDKTNAPERPTGRFGFGNYSMISMYATMMLTASVVSFTGAFVLFWPRMGLPLCYGVFGVPGALLVIILASIGLPKWLERQK